MLPLSTKNIVFNNNNNNNNLFLLNGQFTFFMHNDCDASSFVLS